MWVKPRQETTQTKPAKVVARRGKKEVGANNSLKCGVSVSCSDLHVCRRKFHPTVYYCPSAKTKAEMTYGAPIRMDETRNL
jgi:hypothetical protein